MKLTKETRLRVFAILIGVFLLYYQKAFHPCHPERSEGSYAARDTDPSVVPPSG
ncbi:MAG: hypothetical protein HGJ98_18155 [Desulfosporosinus sp.]|nr:hypothetical protein [Desulfosporosinus sp.]MBC2728358.1 hypothetical protein [Desulfosporosinus sp.]